MPARLAVAGQPGRQPDHRAAEEHVAVHLAHIDRARHPLGQATHGRRQIADRNRQIAGQQIHRAGRQDAQRHRPTGQYARRARHGAIAARHHDGRGAAVARAGHPRRQVTGLLADEQRRQTLIGERRADGSSGPEAPISAPADALTMTAKVRSGRCAVVAISVSLRSLPRCIAALRGVLQPCWRRADVCSRPDWPVIASKLAILVDQV